MTKINMFKFLGFLLLCVTPVYCMIISPYKTACCINTKLTTSKKWQPSEFLIPTDCLYIETNMTGTMP